MSKNMKVLRDGGASSCYYSVLGIRKEASDAEIRLAYRKLALKWHPDRWMRDPKTSREAHDHKFKEIREAYSVLSNKGKRSIYDAALFDLLGDNGDDEGFCQFVQEMISMIESERSHEENSLEDLQKLLLEMMDENEIAKLINFSLQHQPTNCPAKRRRVTKT